MKSPIFHLFFPGRTTKRKEKNYLTTFCSHENLHFFFCLEPTHGVHTNSVYTERDTHDTHTDREVAEALPLTRVRVWGLGYITHTEREVAEALPLALLV